MAADIQAQSRVPFLSMDWKLTMTIIPRGSECRKISYPCAICKKFFFLSLTYTERPKPPYRMTGSKKKFQMLSDTVGMSGFSKAIFSWIFRYLMASDSSLSSAFKWLPSLSIEMGPPSLKRFITGNSATEPVSSSTSKSGFFLIALVSLSLSISWILLTVIYLN